MITPVLAAISGQFLVLTVVWICVFGMVAWAISYFKLPEPFSRIAIAILVCGAIALVVNLLLAFVDREFLKL
jgi:hypothetical protein